MQELCIALLVYIEYTMYSMHVVFVWNDYVVPSYSESNQTNHTAAEEELAILCHQHYNDRQICTHIYMRESTAAQTCHMCFCTQAHTCTQVPLKESSCCVQLLLLGAVFVPRRICLPVGKAPR